MLSYVVLGIINRARDREKNHKNGIDSPLTESSEISQKESFLLNPASLSPHMPRGLHPRTGPLSKVPYLFCKQTVYRLLYRSREAV